MSLTDSKNKKTIQDTIINMKLKNFNYHQIFEILNNPLHFLNAKPTLKVIFFY